MTNLPRTLIIAATAVVLLSLVGGCGKTERPRPSPVKRVAVPNQEPLAYDEYPEWAKKAWAHLVLPDVDHASNFRRGIHYYVDPHSFDVVPKSYTTIENETVFVGDSVYEIISKPVKGRARPNSVWHETCCESILGHFEGDLGGRGWIFPCSQPGRWHSGMGGILGASGEIDADDILKCKQCDRYRETGRVEFQRETGHVQWSRY